MISSRQLRRHLHTSADSKSNEAMADGAGSPTLQELLETQGPLASTNQEMSTDQAAAHVRRGQRLVLPGGVPELKPDESPASRTASPVSTPVPLLTRAEYDAARAAHHLHNKQAPLNMTQQDLEWCRVNCEEDALRRARGESQWEHP